MGLIGNTIEQCLFVLLIVMCISLKLSYDIANIQVLVRINLKLGLLKISMNKFKYRSNNMNDCYCFCRFDYTQEMRENNEEILGMIGCAELYHSECIMLDGKQMKIF